MANALLDFVMSVVNNPDVAAAYAADPGKTIADANLHGVTTADVNGLIPVVSESLSSAAPGAAAGHDANVWTSGAADQAFDAFGGIGDHLQDSAADTLDHFSGKVADHVIDGPSHVMTHPGAAAHSVSASAISDPIPARSILVRWLISPIRRRRRRITSSTMGGATASITITWLPTISTRTPITRIPRRRTSTSSKDQTTHRHGQCIRRTGRVFLSSFVYHGRRKVSRGRARSSAPNPLMTPPRETLPPYLKGGVPTPLRGCSPIHTVVSDRRQGRRHRPSHHMRKAHR